MAIYFDSKPTLKTVTAKVALPKGDPPRHGNLVYLMSPSLNASISMINNHTIYSDNKYQYYYYDTIYRGKIYNRRYILRDINTRKRNYEKVSRETNLRPHPLVPLDQSHNFNTYFDMHKYMQLFLTYIKGAPMRKTVSEFWKLVNSVVSRPDTVGYNKVILINAENYKFTSTELKDLVKNPLFLIYYTLYRYPEMLINTEDKRQAPLVPPLDFYIYCGNFILRIKTAECDKKSYSLVRREIMKLLSHAAPISLDKVMDEESISKQAIKADVADKLNQKYNFIGDADEEDYDEEEIDGPDDVDIPDKKNSEVVNSISKKISDKVDDVSDSVLKGMDGVDPEIRTDIVEQIATDELDQDQGIINDLYTVAMKDKVRTSAASSERDQLLRKEQEKVKVKGMTLKDLDAVRADNVKIKQDNLTKVLHTSNKNLYTNKISNFEKTYNEQCLNKDIANDFTFLNHVSLPMYVISTEVTDTSNEMDYKETWKVTLEDTNRVRHTITVDIPKMFEDKFLYLGGNKKTIVKQNFLYPIVKTDEDTVQIVTNYNKMFIRRMGSKSFSNVERLVKLCSSSDAARSLFKFGNLTSLNRGRMSALEYDELAKTFYQYNSGNVHIFFSRDDIDEKFADLDYDRLKQMPIGLDGKKPIMINLETQKTDDGKTVIDVIVDSMPADVRAEYEKTITGKRLLFNTATIMAQTIPLISLLAYWEGLSTVMKKAGINYVSSDKHTKITPDKASIKFADCEIVYDNTVENQLLMNGMYSFDTKSYNFSDFDTPIPYIDFFKKVYGKASIVNTLVNAYDFFIDSITKEILESQNQPTDIVGVCIYANKLLADNSYTDEGKQNLYRVRSNEIIPAILHYTIANHYIDYRNSAGKHKFSIPRDAVIKQVLALQTVEDYSVLNPVVEVYKTNEVSCKGFRGANLDQAYNEKKRSYDPSMMGIIAMSTSPDGNCGINRELTWEPNIYNARGFIEEKKPEDLKDVNLFSVSELVTSQGVTKDDAIRTAMAGKQTRHVVPTRDACPVLISNGVEEAIKYRLGSDFIVNAEEDGQVVEVNEKTQMMILKYKSGKHRAIDLSSHIVKNGGGGMYLSNQLVSDYKVGDKFKAMDTIAYHKDFFTSDPLNGVRMNIGALTKVAIMSSYNTYQDGSIYTKKLSEKMAANLVFQDTAILGKNSNIDFMVKVGDYVEVGDSLVQFDTSFEENELNKFLKNLGDDIAQEVNENSRNNIKASHSGHIKDIKIYSTIELEEMSPSLRQIVSDYYAHIKERKDNLEKYDSTGSVVKCGVLFTETTGKINPNSYGIIKGNKVEDGVLIEFYIEHVDEVGVGDKGVLFTANKVVFDEGIPEGFEPYSSYRPDEEVSILMGESAILKRMVPSVVLSLLGNKIIVELKNKLKDIYLSK